MILDRNRQKELYKNFLMKCTRNPNSANNYSDFKRINECLSLLFPDKDDLSILDFDDAEEFNVVVEQLNGLPKYIDYNAKGKNQYSNAVAFYQCFLNAKKLFDDAMITNIERDTITQLSYQQIFYGAPGTGKSFTINRDTKGEDVIRTTFHPDTDYSSFVGAYKPSTIRERVMTTIGTKAVPVDNEDGTPRFESKIIYEFVSQSFLQAYIGAWKKYSEVTAGEPKKQFLIIEEINRGNCAQIFGDLFQLLDRNDEGFSDYPITADADMKKQLRKFLKNLTIENKEDINALYDGRDVVNEVLNGDILLLPNNLYIWATMNTSDQSLFPIDSAFKRRWNWRYIPISNRNEGYKIAVNGSYYDWWVFLKAINDKIWDANHSEDKKLGYFFAKADGDKIINSELFVGKVIFYLWNDVFKDFIEESGDIFNDEDGSKLSFDKFYETKPSGETKVVEKKAEQFLKNLGLEPQEKIVPDFYGDTVFGKTAHLQVSFPNGTKIEYDKNGETLVKFIELVKPERVAQLKIVTSYAQNRELLQVQNNDDYQTKPVGGGYYVITKLSIEVIYVKINQISEKLDLGCDVKIIYPE